MLEFGSDFHLCPYPLGRSLTPWGKDANYYIDGRQALLDLLKQQGWQRIWVPSYYCYEFLDSFANHIQIAFYDCNPESDPDAMVGRIAYKKDDVLLRTNYFGLHGFHSSLNLPVEVIEDHSHDLIGEWAMNSNADWCIASLRKTLPIADGGILWSPKHHALPQKPTHTNVSVEFARNRYQAMALKRDYLAGKTGDKQIFRNLYLQTEEQFNLLPISSISEKSYDILSTLNIRKWYKHKQRNWQLFTEHLVSNPYYRILKPEKNGCYPFSMVIVCRNKAIRSEINSRLISKQIYPAVLWNIPNDNFPESQDFGDRILSLHCDGRYSAEEILMMISKFQTII